MKFLARACGNFTSSYSSVQQELVSPSVCVVARCLPHQLAHHSVLGLLGRVGGARKNACLDLLERWCCRLRRGVRTHLIFSAVSLASYTIFVIFAEISHATTISSTAVIFYCVQNCGLTGERQCCMVSSLESLAIYRSLGPTTAVERLRRSCRGDVSFGTVSPAIKQLNCAYLDT